LCCLTRQNKLQENDDETFQEGNIAKYFRHWHAPAILSVPGKIVTLVVFSGLLALGIFGTMNLNVEDSSRAFIPPDSYVNDYIAATDLFFPSQGTDLYIVFEGEDAIFQDRQGLSELKNRLNGLFTKPPYIAEPSSEETYRNVIDGFKRYLDEFGTAAIGGEFLGDDGWPMTKESFTSTLAAYANFTGPGALYASDIVLSEDKQLEAFRVKLKYVRLVKREDFKVIDDAEKLIKAMDSTRDMVDSWNGVPPAVAYSDYFLEIEGFKIIRRELFVNVALAIASVGVIVFITVASPVTSLLITLNVGCCIIEILGFMYLVGIVIDSVAVINIVLAVGLSVDYSAHVGHCFMVKSGNRQRRVTESLTDVGAAVLNGGLSTFLAVVVLLFSSSYVFQVLSKQFALTVGFGLLHGLVALPVMLSVVGPKPFASAEETIDTKRKPIPEPGPDPIQVTAHMQHGESGSDNDL
jgi:hypothetical protein